MRDEKISLQINSGIRHSEIPASDVYGFVSGHAFQACRKRHVRRPPFALHAAAGAEAPEKDPSVWLKPYPDTNLPLQVVYSQFRTMNIFRLPL
jgi:hypothetical protein